MAFFNAPDSIAMFVEIISREATLSVFIPFLLIFPITAEIIKSTKQSKLKEILRLEKLRALGLTDEELAEISSRNKSDDVEEGETTFSSEVEEEEAEAPPV